MNEFHKGSDSDESKEAVRNLLLAENTNLCQGPIRKHRVKANMTERKRMQTINDGFKKLSSLLPERNYKLSKAAILKEAADYIVELKHFLKIYSRTMPMNEDKSQGILHNLRVQLQHEKAEIQQLKMQVKVLRSCANLPVFDYVPESQVVKTVHESGSAGKSIGSYDNREVLLGMLTNEKIAKGMSYETADYFEIQSCEKNTSGEPSDSETIVGEQSCEESVLEESPCKVELSPQKATILEPTSEEAAFEEPLFDNGVKKTEMITLFNRKLKSSNITVELDPFVRCEMKQEHCCRRCSIKDNIDERNESKFVSPFNAESMCHAEYQARLGFEPIFEAIQQVEGNLFET
ncbi:helix-loop-helix protein 11-like [Parasteatoda tepidariorum]|uniref:helix-loop-helix protein 11-like n=1 Tax=Parasteatoda tepidariorum TaxID=114398 RepID=UPI0039BC2E0B